MSRLPVTPSLRSPEAAVTQSQGGWDGQHHGNWDLCNFSERFEVRLISARQHKKKAFCYGVAAGKMVEAWRKNDHDTSTTLGRWLWRRKRHYMAGGLGSKLPFKPAKILAILGWVIAIQFCHVSSNHKQVLRFITLIFFEAPWFLPPSAQVPRRNLSKDWNPRRGLHSFGRFDLPLAQHGAAPTWIPSHLRHDNRCHASGDSGAQKTTQAC